MGEKSSSVEKVYHEVRNRIISRSLFPGYHIVEDNLATEMGTSRTTIRAALALLQQDGFIETLPMRGSFIASHTLEDVISVYETRRILEEGAMRLAVSKVTPDLIDRLEANLDQQRQLSGNNFITEYAMLNRDFHMIIMHAVGNRFVEKYMNELFNKVVIYMLFYDKGLDKTHILDNHIKMFDALKRQDADAVVEAVLADIRMAYEDVLFSFSG